MGEQMNVWVDEGGVEGRGRNGEERAFDRCLLLLLLLRWVVVVVRVTVI